VVHFQISRFFTHSENSCIFDRITGKTFVEFYETLRTGFTTLKLERPVSGKFITITISVISLLRDTVVTIVLQESRQYHGTQKKRSVWHQLDWTHLRVRRVTGRTNVSDSWGAQKKKINSRKVWIRKKKKISSNSNFFESEKRFLKKHMWCEVM
jgi:hypothetical protein